MGCILSDRDLMIRLGILLFDNTAAHFLILQCAYVSVGDVPASSNWSLLVDTRFPVTLRFNHSNETCMWVSGSSICTQNLILAEWHQETPFLCYKTRCSSAHALRSVNWCTITVHFCCYAWWPCCCCLMCYHGYSIQHRLEEHGQYQVSLWENSTELVSERGSRLEGSQLTCCLATDMVPPDSNIRKISYVLLSYFQQWLDGFVFIEVKQIHMDQTHENILLLYVTPCVQLC